MGRSFNSDQLNKVFKLLSAINETDLLSEHDLGSIEASDYRNLSFYIEDGIEVKIGSDDFKKRLGLLKRTFSDQRVDKSEIRYIDLRFDDVAIGPKAIK